MRKIIYVMRGLPSSGKSFMARQLVGNGQIFSTDDYWHLNPEGTYQFDIKKLGIAHRWNQRRALAAIEASISPIVIDNTNITLRELRSYKPHILKALELNYDVEIKEPVTSWAFNIDELKERNTHNVPEEVLRNMLKKWESNTNITVDDILARE